MLNANYYRKLIVICTFRTSGRRNMELLNVAPFYETCVSYFSRVVAAASIIGASGGSDIHW